MARFKPGQSGNPNGRPNGAKTTATLIRSDMVTEEEVKQIVAKVVEMAKGGDLAAAAMVLDRTVPKLRPRVESIAEESSLAEAIQAARLRAAASSGFRVAVLEDLIVDSHAPAVAELQVRTGVVGGLVGGDALPPAPRVSPTEPAIAPPADPAAPEQETGPAFRMRMDPDTDTDSGAYAGRDHYNPMDN